MELRLGKYRHFKGNEYELLGIATHSETLEPMVVYRALYGEGGLYARPVEMFLSPVDREKYPDAPQTLRFEKQRKEPTATCAVGFLIYASVSLSFFVMFYMYLHFG